MIGSVYDMYKNMKKRVNIFLLLMVVLFISLGYAALTSNLIINGTSTINNPLWDVHWNNVQVSSGSVTGTQVTTAAHILTGNTEVEYSITLSTPGDFYEFTVDAVNAGTIDAMIGSFSNKVFESNGTTERSLPNYLTYTVTYSDGVNLGVNHKLASNTIEKYKVRIEFKTDINPEDLPEIADEMVFKFGVTYIQANSNLVVDKPFSGVVYRYTNDHLNIGDSIEGISVTTNPSTLNKNYYLKHGVTGNIIDYSCACFITDKENCLCSTGQAQEVLASTEEWFNNNGGSCTIVRDYVCSNNTLKAGISDYTSGFFVGDTESKCFSVSDVFGGAYCIE